MTFSNTKLIQLSFLTLKDSIYLDKVCSVLAHYSAIILDISQETAFLHSFTTILIKIDDNKTSSLRLSISKLVNENDCLITIEELDDVNLVEDTYTYILRLVGTEISTSMFSRLLNDIKQSGFNIDSVRQLSKIKRMLNNSEYDSYQFYIKGNNEKKTKLKAILNRNYGDHIDFSIQIDDFYTHNKRLICFDMDSTLIKTEVIDELAVRAGVGDEVKAITESAMRGEIDFKQSFTKRVSLLKGLPEHVMIDIAQNLPMMEGIDILMHTLKKKGFVIAILSGGFTYFAKYLQNRYNIDYVFANQLEIINGKLTGKYVGEVVDGDRKLNLLLEIAKKEQIDIKQTIAVGDGANDLPMINAAGLGIAFHAKPKVKRLSTHHINNVGLDGILYFLGINNI